MIAMDAELFWAIVDAARHSVDGWPADLDERWAYGLYTHLMALPPEDALAFDRRLDALRRSAESPEMAAVTQLVVLPYPDSWRDPYYRSFRLKFRSFMNCLVMLGRDTFERAVADPDSLAGHPLLRAVAAGELPGPVLLAVRVDDAPGDAYCELTGMDEEKYLDLVSTTPPDDPDTSDDEEDDDDGDDDGSGAAWLAERFPRLLAIFPLEAERPPD
jgi:hypothetical protein